MRMKRALSLPAVIVALLVVFSVLTASGRHDAFAQDASPQRKTVPHNDPQVITAEEDGTLRLLGPKAELYGRSGPGTIAIYDKEMCIGWWNHKDDYAVWTVDAPSEGVYDVYLHWSIPDNWAGNFFAIEAGESRLINTIASTGGFEHFRVAKYGSIMLQRGRNRVTMRPIGPVNGEIADLKEVRLVPADPDKMPDVPGGGMSPQRSLSHVKLPDAFEITPFAVEPLVTNVTSICVDTHGRVWVAESAVYRFYRADRAGQMPFVDRIKVLEDTDNDGKADKVTVFYEGLMAPMSLAVAGNKVYVAESPKLWVLEDVDGDLRADRKTVLLEGFGGWNDDQALHGLTLGPDHKLYMTQGDLTFDVKGPDGRHVKHDVGAVMRCEFDGTQLEVIAWDLKNPIEVAVDSFGNAWFSGNDDDGTRMCRLDYVLEGGYYGWRYWGIYAQRREIYGSGPEAHWHSNEIGVVPPIMITGFGAPCGQLFIEHDMFGQAYRNAMLLVDPGPRVVRSFTREPAGAGYRALMENFLSNEADTYFRPIDAAVGPDGTLYICDWYDQGVGGHAYNDPNRGRIYRVRRRGNDTHQRIGKPGPYTNDADAVEALQNPNLDTQFHARQRLIASGEKAIPHLRKLLQHDNPVMVARALWVLDRIGGKGRDIVAEHLTHQNEELRALAVRILGRHGVAMQDRVLSRTKDPSALVRREVMLALRRIETPAADAALIELAKQWDGQDRYYLEALGIAARGQAGQANDRFTTFRGPYSTLRLSDDTRMRKLFAALVDHPNAELTPATIQLAKLLRPDHAADYLLQRLTREKLPEATQAAILASLGSAIDADAGRRIIEMIGRDDVAVGIRRIALDAARRNLRGSWNELRDAGELQNAITAALNDPALRADALQAVREAELGWAVPQLIAIASSNAPTGERTAAIDILGAFGSREATPTLLQLLGDERLRERALHALVASFDTDALAQVLTGDHDAAIQAELLRLVMQRTTGAIWMLRLIEEKKLSEALAQRAIASGAAHVDTNVRTLYLRFVPESQRPRTLGESISAAQVLSLEGDPKRGRDVFFYSDAACARCHMVDGQGADIGPSLSVIGRKHGREGLLQAILQPSAAISPDYMATYLETTLGEVHIGFLRELPDNKVQLKTVTGEIITLDADDIVTRRTQSVSLMPEQLAGSMTAQDLADLVAYLSTLQRETQIVPFWWTLGVFPNDNEQGFHTDFGPERNAGVIDHNAEYTGAAGRTLKWERIDTQPYQNSRGVDLQRFVAERGMPTANLVAYYAIAIDSPEAQEAHLLIGSEDAVKAWLNGELVHEHFVRRNPAQLGQDVVTIQLKKGRNILLVKLEQITGGGGLIAALRVRHDVQFGKP